MVSIIPSERGPWDVIGKSIGQNLSQVLPGAVQQGYNRGQLQSSLSKISEIAKNPNSSPLEITLAAMQAGAGIPGSERYLGQLIPELVKFAEARRSQQTPLAGEAQVGIPRAHEAIQAPQNQPLPNFAGQQQPQQQQNFPTNIGPQGGPGNAPQAATTGVKVPLLTPQERIADAKKLAEERTKAGIPTTPRQALEEVDASEQAKKEHNQAIDQELKQRVEAQKNYGQKAVEYLQDKNGNNPDWVTPEIEAVFQKKGEEAATKGKSEAEINRYLAEEAKNFKNMIVNARNDLSAPRSYKFLGRAVNGTYKDLQQSGDDLRRTLKPLLDEGLYDTARKLVSGLEYGPEETAAIVQPLNLQAQSVLAQAPKAPSIKKGPYDRREPADLNAIKDLFFKLKEADPNFSLALARKGMEDLNYSWREIKDGLNLAESEGLKLESDQTNQRGLLDTPALNNLEKILHGLNLIGK